MTYGDVEYQMKKARVDEMASQIDSRGSGTKNVIFQMALTSFLSVLTCSSRCQYDILKVWFKKIDQSPPVGYVKVAVGDLWWEKLLDFTGFPVV